MAEFTTTISELIAKSEQLQEMNTQFKAKTEQLTATQASLNGMWEGEAKATFDNAFHTDIIQMNNFYNAIVTYVNALNQIAQKYSQAESQNVEIARTRSYK